VSSAFHIGTQVDAISACDASRRMHDDALANMVPLRVERLLHDKRALMLATD
jgi:hypothetical protein